MNSTLARARALKLMPTVCSCSSRRAPAVPTCNRPSPRLYDSGEITGKRSKLTLLHGVTDSKPAAFSSSASAKRKRSMPLSCAKIVGAAMRFLKGTASRRTARHSRLDSPPTWPLSRRKARILALGNRTTSKPIPKKDKANVPPLPSSSTGTDPALDAALDRAASLGEAAESTRAISPSSRLTY